MFCKLIVCANQWIKKSDWKDLALVKLCLCAMGVILGLTALRKNRKFALVVSIAIFVATWLPLMKKFVAVVGETLSKPSFADCPACRRIAALLSRKPAEQGADNAPDAAGHEWEDPSADDFCCDLDLA